MIQLKNIQKAFDDKIVLSSFSCAFQKGHAYWIQGPSGTGKTTLLRMICGLDKPDNGEILFTEKPSFSMVFQEDRLIEDLDAVDNILFTNPSSKRSQCIEELSSLLEKDQLSKPVRELSGGMRRRVCIVRATMHPSNIILYDEPFAGLDADNRDKALSYILKNQNKSLPFVLEKEGWGSGYGAGERSEAA